MEMEIDTYHWAATDPDPRMAANREVAYLAERFVEDLDPEVSHLLLSFGVSMRRHIMTRGTAEMAAENRFPRPEVLSRVLERMAAARDREQVIAALRVCAEWADATAIPSIEHMLQESGDDVELTSYCMLALETIGGPDAMRVLRAHADHPHSDRVRGFARHAIRELETGGNCDLLEPEYMNDKSVEERMAHTARHARIPLPEDTVTA
jgi:hypothetical protein